MSEPERPFSPCTKECSFDSVTRRCRGCHRTMDEISGWVGFTPAQRARVWRRVEHLRAAEAGTDPPGETL